MSLIQNERENLIKKAENLRLNATRLAQSGSAGERKIQENIDHPAGFKKRKLLLGFLIIFCLLAVMAAFYFYRQAVIFKNKADDSTAKEKQMAEVIKRVSNLMVLPGGEEPTVATVTDLEKLKDQPFFTNAKVGDKLLIYTKAKKAILYDWEANKIIDVAPLNIGTSTP